MSGGLIGSRYSKSAVRPSVPDIPVSPDPQLGAGRIISKPHPLWLSSLGPFAYLPQRLKFCGCTFNRFTRNVSCALN